MAFRVFSALASLALAATLPVSPANYGSSIVVGQAPVSRTLEVVDYVKPESKYAYRYGVSDPYTGDHKSHEEVRDGGVVRGQYRLLDADGTERVVSYTADDFNGFQATVEKRPVSPAGPPPPPGAAAVNTGGVPTAVSFQEVHRQDGGPGVPVIRETVQTAPVVAKVAPVAANVAPLVRKVVPVVTSRVAGSVPARAPVVAAPGIHPYVPLRPVAVRNPGPTYFADLQRAISYRALNRAYQRPASPYVYYYNF